MPTWAVSFDCHLNTEDHEIVSTVAKVTALADVIRGIPLPPGVQKYIDSLNIMRAVRGTTGIEGTELSETEVEQIISASPEGHVLPQARQRAEQETKNANNVMIFVANTLERDPNYPVTEDLIRTLHQLTTQGIDYPANDPGVYRSHSVHAGTYIPPRTGDEVRCLMAQFIHWLNDGPPRGWAAPIRAIAAHFYLISIHPFGDGNGRTARGLESFLLYQGGINARGFYSLANYYYQNRSEYEAMLDEVRFRTNGNITPFIKFALRGLVTEQEEVHKAILAQVTIIAFRDFARETLTNDGKIGTRTGERMFHFLLHLAGDSVSVAQLRKGGHPLSERYHDVTAKTISRDLNYLRSRQLIRIDNGTVRANYEVMLHFMP
jgi:Fic family protein